MYAPSLNVTVTLTFDVEIPNSRGHLLIMTNHNTKLEDPWAMISLVIDRIRFVYRPTNQHLQSNIHPLRRKGA